MELSSDMIEEILSWVPSKSLSRLKSTCKPWETLITEPRFIKKHLLSCVGIDFDELENPCLNLQGFQPISTSNILVQNMYHCDGLLLFVMRSKKLLVLNPLLKQARWIKCGYGTDKLKDVYGYGLGYISNQSSSSHCDYRIVRFRCGVCNVGKSRIEVYEFSS
ncbi:F-box domain, partial [Arabidopsis suecica]